MQELWSQESWGDFWDKDEFFPKVKQHISVGVSQSFVKLLNNCLSYVQDQNAWMTFYGNRANWNFRDPSTI